MKEEIGQIIKEALINNQSILDLSNNQLTSLPPEIAELKNLTTLELFGNQLTSLPPEIAGLTNLTTLYLFGNQLTSLPPEIAELKNLTALDLSRNQLTSLPSEIVELKNLTALDLSDNQLTSLPPEIAELKNLTALDLSGNQLTSLPPEIAELKNLIGLDLSRNQLTLLPPEILELELEIECEFMGKSKEMSFNGMKLDLGTKISLVSNPLEIPPIEIVKEGRTAIIDYFKSLEGEKQALNEVKVLLVGDGGAGKTSLVKQLLGDKFDEHESQTHGINIRDWEVEEDKDKIKVNFWDFGGQEIMHATHQFFLSKRSLYILVLDGRKEEKTEYWLKHIESFGGNSPILVVLNKIDENPSFDVNRLFLQEKYKGIKGFFQVSCKSKKGLKSFTTNLKDELSKVELRQISFAKSWFKIKSRLENMTEYFISYDEYIRMCIEENITDKSAQDTLVDFLNDLGVILHFKDFELLDTHVLDPKWMTEAVYRIINSEKLVKSNGVLKLKLLDEILKHKNETDYHYPRDKYRYIIDLMKKFELCYEIDKQTVLIPDLLGVQEPKFGFDYVNSLKFLIEYDFLPKSVMPRFIVKKHKDIKDELRWRTGTVLEDKAFHSVAAIKADEEMKKIYIYVNGEQKRDYFSTIRKTFKDINDSFENLEAKELIPLPDNDEITIEYEELIGYESMGKDEYVVGKLRKAYSVKKLLDGIEREEERMKDIEVAKKHGVYVDFKPNFQQNVKQEVSQTQEAKQEVNIGIDIKIELPEIQSDFRKFKREVGKLDDELKEELDDIEEDLLEITSYSEPGKINIAMNKLSMFMQELDDENSKFNKVVKGTKKGIELGQKLGNTYNKFAQWLAMPQVPDLFLG